MGITSVCLCIDCYSLCWWYRKGNSLIWCYETYFAGKDSHCLHNPCNAIIIHEGWNFQTLSNGMALIRIPAIAYSSSIQAVRLPASLSWIRPSYALCLGTNFRWQKCLQYSYTSIICNSECARAFGTIITPSIICISIEGDVSTCLGDSGGPLVMAPSCLHSWYCVLSKLISI